jgi:flotillin
MEASIVEAQMQAEAAEQQADNWAKSETAKLDADLAIGRQETDKRVKAALSKREAMIQEARGSVLAHIAQVKAEINRQKARALQVERQLQADVIQPHDADRRSKEELARGEAAKIIELGKAEAEALRRLVEEYKKVGPGAREILALQQMMPMLEDISGARHPMKIKKLSVLPDGAGDDSLAKRAISAAEQIRAATGVDLPELAKRMASRPALLEAGPGAPPPPSASKSKRPS